MSLEGFQLDFDTNFDVDLDGFVHESLPYSDLNRWVPENSVYSESFAAFPLWRLNDIRQLSFLSYADESEGYYTLPTEHTRLDHSIVVAMVAENIGRQNGLPNEDIKKLIISGLLHDIATPAYGDPTKSIDPEALDEETYWRDAIGERGAAYITGNNIALSEIDAIIHNDGMLGEVLDVADRITYTMKDAYNLIGQPSSKLEINSFLLRPRYILSHYPKIGNIYQDVGVTQKQGVYFIDPDNVNAFLLLRAHLTQSYYLNPASQGRDLYIASLLKPLYARDGSKPFSPQILRQMGDRKLLEELAKYYPMSEITFFGNVTNWYPEYGVFGSIAEADSAAEEFAADDNYRVIGTKACKGFNPATSYKVLDARGEAVEFRDRFPEYARQIEAIAALSRKNYLFYSQSAKIPVPTM